MLTRLRRLARRDRLIWLRGKYRHLRIIEQSPYDNIYYCCTQKTASQWFKAVFSDFAVFKYTGLEVFPFLQIVDRLQDARFGGPLPKRTIGTHLYIGYSTYLTIPKPKKYITFFVLRDPRDIVVSSYFSWRYSHPPMGLVSEFRKDLENLSLADGLKYSIDRLEEIGLFWAQRSWMHISQDQHITNIFRYEDFAHDNCLFLRYLFDYLDIKMPENEFLTLCDRHEFERYSGERKRGVEDPKSHYRKGIAGDWRNFFDRSTMAHFRQVTTNLLDVLGYPE